MGQVWVTVTATKRVALQITGYLAPHPTRKYSSCLPEIHIKDFNPMTRCLFQSQTMYFSPFPTLCVSCRVGHSFKNMQKEQTPDYYKSVGDQALEQNPYLYPNPQSARLPPGKKIGFFCAFYLYCLYIRLKAF